MEEKMPVNAGGRRGQERPAEEVRSALVELMEAGREVGALSLQVAERQLDAAIGVAERVRDDLVGEEQQQRARQQEGLLQSLRQDAHRIVDVVADLGVYLLERGVGETAQETALAGSVHIVEGIGERYAARLADAGIHSCRQLLEAGADRRGREALAEQTGISPGRLLTWINHVDLFRIRGVGEEYAGLLEKAGVDSVPELARRNPEKLHVHLREVNEATGEVRRTPSLNEVTDWVRQAGTMPRTVTH